MLRFLLILNLLSKSLTNGFNIYAIIKAIMNGDNILKTFPIPEKTLL